MRCVVRRDGRWDAGAITARLRALAIARRRILLGVANNAAGALSGGQRQVLATAMAMAMAMALVEDPQTRRMFLGGG